MIAEKYTEMVRKLKYPSMDENRVKEIEDLAGKQNRENALENYKNELRSHRRKHNEEVSKIEQEFKLALFREYNIENNPKAEKVFSIAWERGHSEGYSSVEQEFVELVELILD